MIERIYYTSLDSSKVSPYDQATASRSVAAEVKDVVGDRPLMVCYTDWGAKGEFDKLRGFLDEIFGPSGYATAFLPQAYDAVDGIYRPIGVEVTRGEGMLLDGEEIHRVEKPLKGSNRYIVVPPVSGFSSGEMRTLIPGRRYEIPEGLHTLLLFDDWSTTGITTLGQIVMALDNRECIGFEMVATMTLREKSGLVNYSILSTKDVARQPQSPREIARRRLPQHIRKHVAYLSDKRFSGMLEDSIVPVDGDVPYPDVFIPAVYESSPVGRGRLSFMGDYFKTMRNRVGRWIMGNA